MLLTSLSLLVTALVILITGSIEGSVTLLVASLACGSAGAVALLIAGAVNRAASRVGMEGGEPPIPGYDEMTADQIVQLARTGALARAALAAILAYEASHAARLTVIVAVEEALGVRAGEAGSAAGEAEPAAGEAALAAGEIEKAGAR